MTSSTDTPADPSTAASTAEAEHAAEVDLPGRLRSLWRTFRLGAHAEPGLLAWSLFLALLMMVPDALLAVWLKVFVDGIVAHDGAKIGVAAGATAASVTLTWYLSVASQRVQRKFRDRIAMVMEGHVAELQASVPTIEHHERPDYLDRLAMLRNQVFTLDHMFMSLFSTLGWILRLVVTGILLASVHPALALLLLGAAPAFAVSTWRPGVERVVEERAIHHSRLARHLFTLGTTAPPGKEIRVTGTQQWLVEAHDAEFDAWYRPIARTRVATALWQCAAWAVFAAGYVVAVVTTAHLHTGTAGDVALVLAAGLRLAHYIGATAGELGFLRGFWLDASRRLTWLEDYAASRSAGATGPAPDHLTRGIDLEHVSFRYPGTQRLVLDDVSLHLPAGAVVALVGENGAGKSTMVKLLSGMYAPTGGRILVDGHDLAGIDVAQWRQRLAGAFQDFARFELPAQQSIGLGELPRLDHRPAAETAVRRAGAEDVIHRLAHGLDTQLGPTWPEGAEVSFGQWQKLALARGFMRDAPLLLILDEPTAALDAETEHALFEQFADAARGDSGRGRVTVLVSHRFSTVRMADLIVVLDGAHLAEVGGHDELMARNGPYAELYRIQAAAYHHG